MSSRTMVICSISVIALAACGRGRAQAVANGELDTGALRMTASTPAVGPGVQVTRTDAKSVTRATRYELTSDNFAKFLAAADSLSALEARDSTERAHLMADITDAGSTDADAGLKWLESDSAANAAINNAGISVKDYFVQSIAIAAASHFMGDPKAAPPTPTLSRNAEFLRLHKAELDRLDAQRSGRQVVTVTP
ncbi:MAG: hypothetical protein ACHQWU_13050 [Gemmatimonadales bacterium]